MSPASPQTGSAAADLLRRAASAAKCYPCGCAHEAVRLVGELDHGGTTMAAAVSALAERLQPPRYECFGCAVCWPADAMGLLQDAGILPSAASVCPTDPVEARPGWPPLPGAYTVLRWRAPVAVCTLADDQLAAAVATAAHPAVSIVGTLHTENLGIERLIRNVNSNPNLRFLLVCGTESRQRIGHLPGASLLALAANGVDSRHRIVDAPGRRPFLKNIADADVEHFRRAVTVVDLRDECTLDSVLNASTRCAADHPGPADPAVGAVVIEPVRGYLQPGMRSDPAGYVVIYVDLAHRGLLLEHYTNAGVLTTVVEGRTAAECYTPLVERGLVSRLDHAAYIGRELARAEGALAAATVYVQDGAPVATRPSAQCGPECGDDPGCER